MTLACRAGSGLRMVRKRDKWYANVRAAERILINCSQLIEDARNRYRGAFDN